MSGYPTRRLIAADILMGIVPFGAFGWGQHAAGSWWLFLLGAGPWIAWATWARIERTRDTAQVLAADERAHKSKKRGGR